jgi:hypothetical protein
MVEVFLNPSGVLGTASESPDQDGAPHIGVEVGKVDAMIDSEGFLNQVEVRPTRRKWFFYEDGKPQRRE